MSPARPLDLDSPLISRAVPRLTELATELLDAGLAQIPGTEQLPPGHFTEDVVPSIVAVVATVLRAIDEQREIDADEIAALVVPVVERQAEERIPLRIAIKAFFGGVHRFWQEIAAQAQPADLPDLISLSSLLLDLLEHLNIIMAETHSDVVQSIFGTEREARRELSSALLHGGSAEELAVRADIALADEYDLLAVRVPAGDRRVLLAEDALARRRVRLAREMLNDLSGLSPLHTFDGTTGYVLLPPPADGSDAVRYGNVATELSQQLDAPVVVIEFHAVTRTRLPEAVREIAELSELAMSLGKPAGTYTLDDLMLEYQLTRPGPARDRLATRIVPLLEHPHLFEALQAHIRFGWDRKRAAAAVHLHPNSFSYRLRRVAELTGFDPSEPNDSRMLAAALTVYELFPPQRGAENE
ncbi:PucR family transcriptional regulator [Nocardia neocaledoniensis]|uniref:PucR-like helix-turn-helix protein n=1 Tax=Nocardia neocaledoniensis TaxID=236511 RepID=A0A317N7P0_9NOCA|nr:helix-turn-helix domain-containing protein [Nocardia neocaledoniensis]PWV71039.1 PucR-like helix-turn-helix protein [Nocardia neocaledoniensis]